MAQLGRGRDVIAGLQVQQGMLIVIRRVVRGFIRKDALGLGGFASTQIFRTNQIADS